MPGSNRPGQLWAPKLSMNRRSEKLPRLRASSGAQSMPPCGWGCRHGRFYADPIARGHRQHRRSGVAQGGFKNPQNCSRRRQSAHFSSVTEISADCRRRLRFLESTLGVAPAEKFLLDTMMENAENAPTIAESAGLPDRMAGTPLEAGCRSR